jgi:hypothetical protein
MACCIIFFTCANLIFLTVQGKREKIFLLCLLSISTCRTILLCSTWSLPLDMIKLYFSYLQILFSSQTLTFKIIYPTSYKNKYKPGDSQFELVQANSSQDPILKIFNTKKGWWNGSRFRP